MKVLRNWLAALRTHWLTAVGLVAVAALIIAVKPPKLLRALESADVAALLWMLPVVLLLYFFHGLAWWICLRRVGAGTGFKTAQQVTYLSQAFVFLPGGDLWRVAIIRRTARPRVPAGVLVGSVVFDDLVFMFVMSFAMLPAVVQMPSLAIPLGVLLAPQLAIFAVLTRPGLYHLLAARAGRLPLLRRFEPQLQQLGPTFKSLATPRTLVPVMLVDAICVVLTVTLFALSVAAVHATGASLTRVAFTYSATQVGAMLTVLPAALGAYEGMITGLLSVQGIAAAAAAAAALLYRAVNDVLMAFIGLGLALVTEGELAPAAARPRERRPPSLDRDAPQA